MSAPTPNQTPPTVLIVAAGRGLGHAIAEQFLAKGWQVIGTVRPGSPRTRLHDLAETAGGRVEIETADINEPEQVAALRRRLDGRALDVLFVNAGITTRDEHIPIGEVTTEEFNDVMLTNALSPMRVIEALQDLVTPTGLIGAMSSGQGSIANNATGLREVYRGSKAALNQFMRSFAVRQPERARTLLVMAPGWVRTDLGGAEAPLGIEDSIPRLVNVMLAQCGTPGVQFLDYQGRTVPW
ncbi:SDR family oxidoreductase [Kitasatospora sp. NBC_01302]|uniref:SDR family oxidoreductase n=1 Tax=Kitasatospora sp. NBC_01302 TaxID=2903575 RepID=UPI002E1198B1|nr:SDR family oxidoreductase [Kitasatospora sp. NBC_01302]